MRDVLAWLVHSELEEQAIYISLDVSLTYQHVFYIDVFPYNVPGLFRSITASEIHMLNYSSCMSVLHLQTFVFACHDQINKV